MDDLTADVSLEALLAEHDALLVLYGAPTCRVCGDVKPHLSAAMTRAYPQMKQVYVNCNDQVQTCAQRGVFSLPVVQVYLGGQKVLEKVRVFSPAALVDELARPMALFLTPEA